MSESFFRTKLCTNLRKFGAVVIPIVGSRRQMAGTPDIYLSHKRVQTWIEFKGKKTVIREIQLVMMRKLYESGSGIFIIKEPNLILDWKGDQLGKYETTMDLICKLQEYRERYREERL